jgi:hypothetical protein
MEHSCAKCGAAVEDGVPFCKHCGAPQIRVLGIEPQPVPVPETHDSEPERTIVLPELLLQPQSGRIQWSQALPCAALGGAFSLLLLFPAAALSVGSAGGSFVMSGLAFLLGGAWAARLYYRKARPVSTTPGVGAKIGAASGAFGFLFFAVIIVATAVYRADEIRKTVTDYAHQLTSQGGDPDKVKQMLDTLNAPGGLGVMVAFALCALLVIFVAGSSIGGAWYGAWMRKRMRS